MERALAHWSALGLFAASEPRDLVCLGGFDEAFVYELLSHITHGIRRVQVDYLLAPLQSRGVRDERHGVYVHPGCDGVLICTMSDSWEANGDFRWVLLLGFGYMNAELPTIHPSSCT